ncbi:type II toxin-antitoxin system HigB family toxin [Desulfoferrobacter suflitae]|uniref:type II toxin-antitoxin system HigB family toxin n=1 Tax=Desulfoferrobacter suflitae TaxID=2865782 RepID=UPI002164EFDA|nr:type II toxin-antitoxin system HigB family toxin [Desulfoferrobacter suflitae]MCK8603298.1 type II toxin-antitoxin system HigB family toxin [Desulfoferrobacter suflitae]
MWIITKDKLRRFWEVHKPARSPLEDWYRVANKAKWEHINHVRRVFPSADAVEVKSGRTATVFNISWNNYRLIASIHYNRGKIFILDVLTHAEYSKGAWKEKY